MANTIKLTQFRVEQRQGEVKVEDRYPLTFSWSIPPVKYHCDGAISELENGHYRIGFIQYITDYRFDFDYKNTRVVIDVKTPISDCGGTSGNAQPEKVQAGFRKHGLSQGNVYDMVSVFPWYEPPLVFQGPYTGGRRERKYFNLESGDAPNGTALWVWPFDSNKKAIQETDNALKRIERVHNFVTCAVLWNHTTSQLTQVLGKAEWTHKLVIEADSTRSIPRLKARLEDPDVKVTSDVPAGFTIPPACLRGPCANASARSCLREDTKTPAGIAAKRTQSIQVKAGDTRTFKWEVKEVPRVRLSQTGRS